MKLVGDPGGVKPDARPLRPPDAPGGTAHLRPIHHRATEGTENTEPTSTLPQKHLWGVVAGLRVLRGSVVNRVVDVG